MKKYILIFAIILQAQTNVHATQILDAVNKKLIQYSIVSLGDHSGKCIEWNIVNLTNTSQEIEIPMGYLLLNSDSTHQNLILAENVLANIPAKGSKNITTNAYCVTMHKGSPENKIDQFKITSFATAQLLAVLQLIKQYKVQNYTSQQAIWSSLGDADPRNIDGDDSMGVTSLRKEICKQRKLIMTPYTRSSYVVPHVDTTTELTIRQRGNMFVDKLKNGDKVELFIVSATDSILYKENLLPIYKDEYMSEIKWKTELGNLDPKKVYYMRIKINGVVRKERKFDFFV